MNPKSDETSCARCGAALKIVSVQVPLYSHYMVEGHTLPFRGEIKGYEVREEPADCPRCTGGY